MSRLNVGSGYLNRRDDEIALDINLQCKPNICGDVQCLPFKTETFDEVVATHVFEHVPNIVKAMNEINRVMKPGGKLYVRVPLFPTLGSIADPSHVRFFIPQTFEYFTVPGKLTGLKAPMRMEGMFISQLTAETQEINCTLIKQ